MEHKFPECEHCINRRTEVCDDCDSGEFYEEDDELPDFDDDEYRRFQMRMAA